MAGKEQAHEAGATKPGSQPVEHLMTRVRRGDTFFLLFFLLLVSLALIIGATGSPWGRVVGQVLTGATLLVAVRASYASRRWIILGWIALLLAGMGALIGEWSSVNAVRALVGLVFMVLLVSSVPLILRRLAAHEQVTGETVAGALCVYLLIGMAFASLNLAISNIGGHDVLMSNASPGSELSRGDFYYYSFINMATVGFGDIVPATNAVKMLAVFQAVLGQLFLITVVARLVSVAILKPKKPGPPDTPQSTDNSESTSGGPASAGREPEAEGP